MTDAVACRKGRSQVHKGPFWMFSLRNFGASVSSLPLMQGGREEGATPEQDLWSPGASGPRRFVCQCFENELVTPKQCTGLTPSLLHIFGQVMFPLNNQFEIVICARPSGSSYRGA